ncbi:Cellulose synthase (UDP-forming) [Bertholletia excelsa]
MGQQQRFLHSHTSPQPTILINRVHIFFHFLLLLSLLYYRFSCLFVGGVPLLPWSLITFAELLLGLSWVLQQAFRWQPVIRSVYPENISSDGELPRVDVFICTADPRKEPTVDVMNTVVSSMALDYPPEKLAVYLSDDSGAPLTLYAIREACEFARAWVPFCRRYGIRTISPYAYFSKMADDERLLRSAGEFRAEEDQIRSSYEEFKKRIEKACEGGEISDSVLIDRPACIEVIQESKMDSQYDEQNRLPLLVYLSRERRPSHPHRFKAGALNTLLRVSGLFSNAPYFMVLDCDMFCNEASSARQAMCFHLDPKMSHSLAFVQFPQIFHNLADNDVYNSQGRATIKSQWHGMDGVGGTFLCGTGYYMKRKALFGTPDNDVLRETEEILGLHSGNGQETDRNRITSDAALEKARLFATCTFEQNSNWGKQIGFSYDSMLESSFTGYILHCRGWRSVYLYPKKPAFLGCAPIDLKDGATQLMKWISGLLQIGLSEFNPITYGMSRMSIFQSMCYAFFIYINLYSISLLLYGTVPQWCFWNGTPLYPKVSDPWFWLFAVIYASSLFEQLYEGLTNDGSLKICWNEYRIWMMTAITGALFGGIDALVKLAGMGKANFRLTNKAINEEKLKKYEKGKFDFSGAGIFVIPLAILITLNMICFVGGVTTMIVEMSFEDMIVQFFLSSLIMLASYPLIGAIVTMKR